MYERGSCLARCGAALRVGLTLCAICPGLAGCLSEPEADFDGADLALTVTKYIDLLTALGVKQGYDRVAQSVPDYLLDVPGVDGAGPFEVESIKNVPFRPTASGTLTLNVHRPIAADAGLRRAVVLYSGGIYVTDAEFDTLEVWAEYLASRGFVAFNTHQRLLGDAGVTWREVFADAIAAVRFVAAEGPRFGADPQRIATLGRSSGGQLALLVGMIPDPELFGPAGDPAVPLHVGAIVDLSGPSDYRRFFTTNEFSLLPRAATAAVFGGTPDEVPDAYEAASPLTYVRPGLPPTLIVHGELDSTVPLSHSIILADALEAQGNLVQREFYPDLGHTFGWGLIHNDGFGRAMIQVVRFLERNL